MTDHLPIYMAYGSNLNKRQMAIRCPDAKCLGWTLIPDYRLVFRGVADMIEAPGEYCPIGLWKITTKCETSLDRYEGYPTLYGKKYLRNKDSGITYMFYAMNEYDLSMPSQIYLESIRQGYEDFGINKKYLTEALDFTSEYQSDNGYYSKRMAAR
jgi:hypothetical protein